MPEEDVEEDTHNEKPRHSVTVEQIFVKDTDLKASLLASTDSSFLPSPHKRVRKAVSSSNILAGPAVSS